MNIILFSTTNVSLFNTTDRYGTLPRSTSNSLRVFFDLWPEMSILCSFRKGGDTLSVTDKGKIMGGGINLVSYIA